MTNVSRQVGTAQAAQRVVPRGINGRALQNAERQQQREVELFDEEPRPTPFSQRTIADAVVYATVASGVATVVGFLVTVRASSVTRLAVTIALFAVGGIIGVPVLRALEHHRGR